MPENNQLTIVERYRQLIEKLQELASILNTEQLHEQIVEAATELCHAEEAWLLLSDPPNKGLQIKACSLPNSTQYCGFTVPIESSLEGWVMVNQKPLMVNHPLLSDQNCGEMTIPTKLEIKSILSIPLSINEKPIGVLEVVNKHGGDFSVLDKEILVSFTNQIATYINNTHLFLQSDLVAELVHELRTPLVSLNMAVHLLQRPDLADDKRGRIFEMISTEFNRMSNMTTSFLEFARLESGRAKFTPTRFDLLKLVEESLEVMQFQATAKGVQINLQSPIQLLIVTADRDKLKQVILNLLINAIKYNRPGGKVSIDFGLTITEVSFSIRDDGQGIPPEYIPMLFDRFFRIPNQEHLSVGTGLGLTICKQIITAHKGRIEVTSAIGQGTAFTVYLPVTGDI
jgi:signal transduction histidine kinase